MNPTLHSPKVLLINSPAPRPRTLSDTLLENSLALLRTTLERHQIEVSIWDRNTHHLNNPLEQQKLVKTLRKSYRRYFACKRLKLSVLTRIMTGRINRLQTRLDEILYKKQTQYIQEICRLIQASDIRIVGLKCWYGDAFKWATQLVEEIQRRFSHVITVGGGPHVNVHQEKLFEFSSFDALIYPEGEKALVELVTRVKDHPDRQDLLESLARDPIPNVSTRRNMNAVIEPVPLDEKTIPTYQESKANKTLIHSLQEARGCDWNKCTFCSHPEIFPKFKVRAVDHVMQEIESCLREGIGIFRFTASDTPMPIATKIAKSILARNWSIEYSMFTRAVKSAHNRYQQIVSNYETMLASGLRAIFMGGETGHDRINLEVMNKGVKSLDMIMTIKAIRQASHNSGYPIDIVLALIYPTPLLEGVTHDDVFKDNLCLIQDCAPDSVIISPPAVFPRTAWWREPEKYGFRIHKDWHKTLVFYEYALYKPTELWELTDYGLGDLDLKGILAETARLRETVSNLGIQTEVTDEYLLMARSAGFNTPKQLKQFKTESLLDILSGDNTFSTQVYEKINLRSQALAAKSIARETVPHRHPERAERTKDPVVS